MLAAVELPQITVTGKRVAAVVARTLAAGSESQADQKATSGSALLK
jgi:hypothetical protein